MENKNNLLPVIGITLGDVAGIGPEVIAKAFVGGRFKKGVLPLVIGEAQPLRERLDWLGIKKTVISWGEIPSRMPGEDEIFVLEPDCERVTEFEWGRAQAQTGEAAFQAILLAVKLAQKGSIKAIVTAPICKEALHLAGRKYDGHTGLIAELVDCKAYSMTFATKDLKICHTTAHLALKDATALVTKERISEVIDLGWNHLKQMGIENPRIAVCGLNPHAGEEGIFGTEEQAQIIPAIKEAQAAGKNVQGPFPGDTVFIAAFAGKWDMVVAQYHDQGHIPGKLMAFDSGVNVTIGLPIIRTSVDHGTAFDIVKDKTAKEGNFFYAYNYALQMAGL
ncbi:MAG: 4-hydroxythreonine-4-phosphate dehydrogenase PdxA [SAR324 cluster bacterium]|nr:4-hydroxythreonine-4-phosphate dehydrogenase PdxA [SAR324 cluster bacterium]